MTIEEIIKRQKEHLTKAQIGELIQATERYKQLNASNRASAMRTLSDQYRATRRGLQNTGLAGRKGKLISGQEKAARIRANEAYRSYNAGLRQIDNAYAQNRAARMANETARENQLAEIEKIQAENDKEAERINAEYEAWLRKKKAAEDEYKRQQKEIERLRAQQQQQIRERIEEDRTEQSGVVQGSRIQRLAKDKHPQLETSDYARAAQEQAVQRAVNGYKQTQKVFRQQREADAMYDAMHPGSAITRAPHTDDYVMEQKRVENARQLKVSGASDAEVWFADAYGVSPNRYKTVKNENPELIKELTGAVQDLRTKNYDTVINTQGNIYDKHQAREDKAKAESAISKAAVAMSIESNEMRNLYLMNDTQFEIARAAAAAMLSSAQLREQTTRGDAYRYAESDYYNGIPTSANPAAQEEVKRATERLAMFDAVAEMRSQTSDKALYYDGYPSDVKTKDAKTVRSFCAINQNTTPYAWANPKNENGENWYQAAQNGWKAENDGNTKYGALVNDWSLVGGRQGMRYQQTGKVAALLANVMPHFYDLADETGTYSNAFEDTHVQSWAVHNGISTADYYDYVRNSCVKAFYGNNASHEDYEQMDAMLALANLMTDEERARFNELANGSYGAFANEADEYFEYLYKNVLPERFKAYVDELNGVFTDTTYGKIGQSTLSVLTNLGEGITGPIHTLTTNYNDSVSAQLGAMKYTTAQAARESVSKDFSPVGKFFYDEGMSIADSGTVALISGGIGKALQGAGVASNIASKAGSVLGGSILGGSAFNSAYKEALDRGLSPDKARLTAVGQGINEMLFESLSIELLFDHFKKGGMLKFFKNRWANLGVNVAASTVSEGSEEVVTEAFNTLWDKQVNSIYSKMDVQLRKYVAEGDSFEVAWKKVQDEYAEELGMAFAGGALSGGVMGGGASFLGMVQNRGNEKVGKGLRQNSRVMNELRNFDFKSEYAQEILTQDKLTNQDVADLFNIRQQELLGQYESDIQQAVADGKITQEQADLLKKYEQNGVQIVHDGEVVANENGITVEQMPSVQDAIANLDNAARIQFLNNEEMRSLVQAVGGETAAVIEQSETAEREAEKAYRQTIAEINSDTTLTDEQKAERKEEAKRTRQNARSEAEKIADAALTNKKGIGAKLETDGNGTVKVGKGSGKVTYDFSTKDNPGHQTVDSMTATEQSALRIAKVVAASRPDVNVKVEAEFVGEHANENGYYDRSTNTIHINMSGDNSVLWTLSHELTHHLANTDTEAYTALRTAIETALKDSKLTTTELEDRGFEYDLDRVDPYIAREGNLWDALVAFEREEHGYGKDAEEEVVARCCESFLGFDQFVKDFARKQYKSARAVNKFIAQMNIDMQRVSEDARQSAAQRNVWNDESPENQILRQLTEIDRIANLWRIAVNAEAKKNKASGDTKNEDIRYSFRGRVALYSKPGSLDVQDLRDKQGKANLNIAYKMDREGIDSEKIRLATGWFKGYDGKWRNEIDDSGAKLADWLVLGKAMNYMEEKARKAEGDLWDRISSLEDRLKKSNKVNGSDSEQSKALRKELRQTKKQREEARDFCHRISTNRLKLSDILDHAKLYENYPQLKDVSVHLSYSDRTGGYLGSATGTTDITIVTDRNSKGEILESLMHEVQHIIQGIEGFAKGANVEYWADRNKRESADVKESKATLAQVERELARVKYDGNPQASPLKSAVSYAYITDLLRTDKPGTANYAYDTEQKEKYEKRAEEGGYADLLQKYLFAYQDVKVAEMEAKDYTKAFADYQRTAGEVEARDVASRLHMSEDERKATRPDIDRSDVTFFETDRTGEDSWKNEDIRYSKADNVKLSTKENDAQYMDLARRYESGDKSVEAELRKAVDAAAKAAGYNEHGFHRTSANFYIFDRAKQGTRFGGYSRLGKGFYFAHEYFDTQQYSDGSRVIEAYLSMKKPYDGRKPMTEDIKAKVDEYYKNKEQNGYDPTYPISKEQFLKNLEWEKAVDIGTPSLFLDHFKYDKNGKMTDGVRDFLESMGYDGIITDNEIVVFDPSQIKSADLITRDDNGNIIPLSERFKTDRTGEDAWKNEDIRYSLKDKVRLSTADGTRTYTLGDVTAKLYGNDVELDGGKVRQRVSMMEAIAEVNGTARVDAASEEEAEAFRRAGAEQVVEELEGHGAKYGTWEFKYEERKFTNDSRYDIKQKQKFAKDILKQVGKSSGFTQAQRVKYGAALGRLMDYLWEMQYGKMDGKVVFDFADRLFDSILNDYSALSKADDEFRSELLANMTKAKNAKGSTVYVLEVNDKQMREIKYAYENAMVYASRLSKALGARVTVKQTDNAKTLEDIFTNSTDTRIKSDTNEGDMPGELLRLAQETESRKTNPYAAESEERQALKIGMFDAAMDAAGVEKSTAQQIREAVKETRKAERTKAKTEAKKAIDSARLAERMHEGALRAKDRRISENRERALKQHAAEREAKLKQGFRETTQKANETRLKRDMRTIALKWNQRLVKLLANPTEASHVPIQLAREVAELTKTITEYLDSGTERGRINLDKVIKAYQQAFDDQSTIAEAQKENPKYDPRGTVIDREMYDEYLVQMMNRMNEIVAEKSFKDLSAYEMKALLDIIRGVAHTVYDANRMIGTSERRAIWEVGDRMVTELEEAPSVSARKYLNASLDLRRLALIYNGSNENAEMVNLVGMLNDGAIEKERVAQQLSGMFSELTAEHAKEMRKWYGKNAEWIDTGIVKHGKKVEITKGMRISLAMHVLNEGNMNHITNGGITIPDRELYNKGKLNDAYANGTLVRLDKEQIHAIISQMTETEKAYLEIAKEFFHKRTGYYVNKTSLQLLGYRKATVENYFPIHTDRNYTRSDFAAVMRDGSIEGQGFLRERVMATNPVYLEDITSVVNRQIKGVSLYAGLAVPMRNFNAVMNASIYEDENGRWLPRTTVRKTMTQKMGDYGAKVVQEFLQDVSGMSAVDVKPSERIVAKLQTRYVKAVLLANLKVTLKQAASYPTAAAVIPWKYLMKALRKGGKNHRLISRADVDLINQYTPLYQMRRDGMANEITSIMAERGLEQKMPWLLGWITKMDVATVGRLWSACEYMVADQQNNLPVGSDEYYKAVAKVFNKTIQETQPNFTPLQRNAALRSKNPIVRTLVLFGTQRMQNGGILIENAMALKQAQTPEARKAARVKLGRAVASQIIQNALLILMGFAVDAVRGRMKGWNDEDKELTKDSVLMNVGDQFMSNILGSFLGGSEIWDIGSGLVKKSLGKSAYDTEFTIPALDALETIISFGKDEIPSFIRYMAGDASAYEKQHKAQAFTKKLAKAAGYVTGFPFENMTKDLFDGINPLIQDIVHGVDAGEFIPWLHNSGRLDKEKTNTLYKEWTRNGFKGSEFFYWTDKLQGVSGGREGRIPVLMESDLTNEQKALLMRMMDTSGGYEQGTAFYNKKGELIVDFANPTEKQALPMPDAEPSEEPSAEPVAEATPQPTENPLSEAKQEGVRQAVAKGVDEQTANDAFLAYQNMGKNHGDDYSRNDDFRAWLFKNVQKPEERAILEYQVIGQASKVEGAVTYRDSGVVYRDYTNESWFKLSEHNLSKDGTNKRYEAGKRLEKTGLSVDKTVAIYDGLKELTKKAEWTDYLKKQGLTEEQINIFLWSRGWAK